MPASAPEFVGASQIAQRVNLHFELLYPSNMSYPLSLILGWFQVVRPLHLFEVDPKLIESSRPLTLRGKRIYEISEATIQVSLVLYALFEPHSIAITEGSYLVGAVAWAGQLWVTRSFKKLKTPADLALLGFFACCFLSSCFSYYPLLSFNGLRSPAFFLAFYFVSSKVRSMGSARFLIFALIGSCLINVGASAAQLIKGRGLRIDSFQSGSPLAGHDLKIGDVIVRADDKAINSLQDLSDAIDSSRGRLAIKFERKESDLETIVSRKALSNAEGVGGQRLGIAVSKGRSFRVTGFYSHYETYAEVLQLIASLAIGMLIALPRKRTGLRVFLGVAAILIGTALVLTSTRSALAGLALSIIVMAITSFRPRIAILAVIVLLLAAPAAIFEVQHIRGISFIDPTEGSTAYRLEIWQEAFRLIKNNPLTGIGKGSDGEMWEKFGLFKHGTLPPGHFHSSPIQVAVWWGLPALALYAAFMLIFVVETWRLARRFRAGRQWDELGMSLGLLGALVAFNVSSLVQFNFGDGEVSMALWLLAGLSFAMRRLQLESLNGPSLKPKEATPEEDRSARSQFQQQATLSAPGGQGPAVTQS